MPILMYHQVSPRPLRAFARYTVTPKVFGAQMRWLSMAGYVPVTLDQLVDHRSGRADLPRRSVVITFDDGFQEVVEHAVPILRAHGFTATFYLVAGLMGKNGHWLRAEIGTDIPIMKWSSARELEAAGFRCAAHTMSHPRLATLADSECRKELGDSMRLLEDELGRAVTDLAYPYGSYDSRVREIAAEVGYRTACSTRPGFAMPGDDLLALRRVSVYGHESLLSFVSRLATSRSVREFFRRDFSAGEQRMGERAPSPRPSLRSS